jgi:1-acyl-sn-glycerol-3-phosphate acyltransferase
MRRIPLYDDAMTRASSEPIYATAVVVGRALFGFWRLRRTASGLANIPDTGGAVLAMTHFGYLEFALVEWATYLHNRRRIRFMAKKSAFEKPLIGGLLRGMRHIAVDMKAGGAAYAEAVKALQAGELIGVFPEAGVNSSFTVRDLKTGAARLAAEAGVPIIPIAVWGGQRLLTKNHRISFRERFGVTVSYAVGTPVKVTKDDDIVVVTTELRKTLQGLVDALQRDYPVDGTGKWWQPRHLGGTAPTPEEAAAADAARTLRRQQAAERAAEKGSRKKR